MGAQRDDTATRTETPPVGGDGAMDDRTSWVGDTTIRETPGVCGGYPCVGHTRVSVRNVVVVYKQTGGNFEQTAQVFDMLTASRSGRRWITTSSTQPELMRTSSGMRERGRSLPVSDGRLRGPALH